MKIKICGISSRDDALAAVEAGADMIGYNFYPKSPRFIEPRACAAIQDELARRGAAVIAVGVFVNASLASILRISTRCALDLVQLHGDEPPELLARLGDFAYKAIRPTTLSEAQRALELYPLRSAGPALLVDAHGPGVYGGGGRIGDWDIAKRLATERPLLLAGGLNPENVGRAAAQVNPWGVDVASGVESAPGVKDLAKMRAFVAAARAA